MFKSWVVTAYGWSQCGVIGILRMIIFENLLSANNLKNTIQKISVSFRMLWLEIFWGSLEHNSTCLEVIFLNSFVMCVDSLSAKCSLSWLVPSDVNTGTLTLTMEDTCSHVNVYLSLFCDPNFSQGTWLFLWI